LHKVLFDKPVEGPYKLLFLGAHADDIEIGCGGTILRLLGEYSIGEVSWIVFSAGGQRATEARQSADVLLDGLESKRVEIRSFRDGFFPYSGGEIKEYFEALKTFVSPDIIFTHYRNDLHQDHRLISDLTWNTFRDHLILEYEIPKYDGDLGQPNFFVPLDSELCEKKVHYLLEAFRSQERKRWFGQDTFLSLMRLRGMECNAPSGYAEAFFCRKLSL